jgi:hypothetical protein
VVVLRGHEGGGGELDSYVKEGATYVQKQGRPLAVGEGAWLTPRVVHAGGASFVGLHDGESFELLSGPLLLPVGNPRRLSGVALALLAVPSPADRPPTLVLEGGRALYHGGGSKLQADLGWTPCVPAGSSLRAPPLAWHPRSATDLEVAGLGPDGTVFWSLLEVRPEGMRVASASVSSVNGYRAVAVVRPWLVAAAGPSRVHWLRAGSRTFSWSMTQVALPNPVACFPCRPTGELIIVCGDGEVVRLAVPG